MGCNAIKEMMLIIRYCFFPTLDICNIVQFLTSIFGKVQNWKYDVKAGFVNITVINHKNPSHVVITRRKFNLDIKNVKMFMFWGSPVLISVRDNYKD